LITEPEEFLPAIKKEILKKTGNIKANLMKQIKDLFPEKCEPFIGGLGNRENDAIAYHHAGIDLKDIFIIDTKSYVHKMDTADFGLTYKEMAN
jgi:phosphatidate phosphatase PAH1